MSQQDENDSTVADVWCRYNFKPTFWRADFEVKIIIGPADMRFQIFDKNGQISKDHEEIEVLWDPPQRKGLVPFVAEREIFGIYQP